MGNLNPGLPLQYFFRLDAWEREDPNQYQQIGYKKK
jgi:hypothetical protein